MLEDAYRAFTCFRRLSLILKMKTNKTVSTECLYFSHLSSNTEQPTNIIKELTSCRTTSVFSAYDLAQNFKREEWTFLYLCDPEGLQ